MSVLNNAEQKSRHGTSTRSNVTSIRFPESLTVPKTSQTLHGANGVQPKLTKADLNTNNQQDETTPNQRTRGWVHGRNGYSHIGDQEQERRDWTNKQIRSADTLLGDLSRSKTTDGKLKSDNAVQSETKCQSLQFVGSWTDEKYKEYGKEIAGLGEVQARSFSSTISN
ncbi:hypothetical protein CLAIMM_01291 [Cladophialophora immunda]|nr:hypothetical protein CLAIMM_01291 [Cladophialophora immunda]